MEFPFEQKTFSEEETVELAGRFSEKLFPGKVIILNGNLGAGKTFFIKSLLKNFGIENVSSPTFAIVNEYNGKFKFYHFDFYRIKNSAELFDIGFNDYLNDSDSIMLIEWGELFPQVLPNKRLEIRINILDDNSREFIFNEYA